MLFDGSFGELGGFFSSTEVLRDETKEPVGTKEGMNGGWGSEENVTSYGCGRGRGYRGVDIRNMG